MASQGRPRPTAFRYVETTQEPQGALPRIARPANHAEETGMRIKNQRDFWAGVMFLVVGIGFTWGSTSYSFGSSARPGPGYFPFGLGILLAVLGCIELFKALTIEIEGGNPIGAVPWRPLLIIVGVIAFFGYALPHLGMFIALPLLVIVSSMAGDEFKWRDAILNAIVLTVFSWLIFSKGLGLVIPLTPSFGAAG